MQFGVANALGSATSIVFNGGTLSTGATTGFAAATGTLQLTDNSTLALGTANSATLSFTNSSAVAWTSTKTLIITGWVGGYNGTGAIGTNNKIFVGNTAGTLTAAQLGQIEFLNTTYFAATQLSTGEIVPLATAGPQWWVGTGATWTASTWGTFVNGPFTSAWGTGVANFDIANSTITGATTSFAGINAYENVTVTPTASTTLSTTGNIVAPIFVASGKTFDFGTQALTGATAGGYIKNGPGTLIISAGGTYSGGFTLNAGTMQIGAANAMGSASPNTLTINGGVLTSSSSTSYNLGTGKYPGGITIGGDFQLAMQ